MKSLLTTPLAQQQSQAVRVEVELHGTGEVLRAPGAVDKVLMFSERVYLVWK